MKILITGGAGFVGGNLCRVLAAGDHEIRVLDDLSTGYRSNIDGVGVDLTVGSILDPVAVKKVMCGVDAVVHLAALGSVPRSVADPLATNETNVNGSLHVLQAAREVDAYVIVASSSSVYGSNLTTPKHEALVPQPMSPYAVSKLASESYGIAFQKSYGLQTLVFRFFNIFGPLQSARHPYAAVVPSFVSALVDEDPLQIFGDGLQSRDFTSITSVTNVIAEALRRRVTHEYPVNLAFGTNTNLLELVDRLILISGRKSEVEHLPPRVGDVRTSQADNTVLRSLFASIQPESLDDGLERTVSWFLETNAKQW